MSDQTPHAIKAERSRRLRRLGDELRRDFHQREVGRSGRVQALVEALGPGDDDTDRELFAITDNYIKILGRGPASLLGREVDFDVAEITADHLTARPLGRVTA